MTMLLPGTTGTPQATGLRRPAANRLPSGAAANRSRPVPTAALLRLVETADDGLELVAVGIAIHSLTDPLRQFTRVDALNVHRATTVLTKQVTSLFSSASPLEAIRELVTDAGRPALPDGRPASVLAGAAWPAVRELAFERASAAVEGAGTFGETAILRLAATRAAAPTCRWWGTAGWIESVERWASDQQPNRRAVTALLHAPELAGDEILAAVLDH